MSIWHGTSMHFINLISDIDICSCWNTTLEGYKADSHRTCFLGCIVLQFCSNWIDLNNFSFQASIGGSSLPLRPRKTTPENVNRLTFLFSLCSIIFLLDFQLQKIYKLLGGHIISDMNAHFSLYLLQIRISDWEDSRVKISCLRSCLSPGCFVCGVDMEFGC